MSEAQACSDSDGSIPLAPIDASIEAAPAVNPENTAPNPKNGLAPGHYCRNCGYELAGLSGTSKCPECAFPIARSEVDGEDDQLALAPLDWLETLHLGALALLIGAGVSVSGVFACQFSISWQINCWPLGGAISWAAGVWIVTRPRAAAVSRKGSPQQEWRLTRALARWSQLAWIPAALILILVNSVLTLSSGMVNVMFLLAAIGLIGLPIVFMQLSRLALWANDDDLARRMIHCSAIAPCGLSVAILILQRVSIPSLLSTAFFLMSGSLLIMMVIAVPLGYVVRLLARFRSMVGWARLYHSKADDKELRLAQRALRARRLEEAKRAAGAGGATAPMRAARPSRSSRGGVRN